MNDTEYTVLECQFVGTVFTNLEWGLSYTITVRLGKLENEPTIDAEDLINKYYDTKGSWMVVPPSGKELDSIRNVRRQLAGRA